MAASERLALVPVFGSRRRSLIQRMLFQDEHVEMLVEGPCKAGLKVV